LNEALSAVPGLEYVLKHRLKTSAGALLTLGDILPMPMFATLRHSIVVLP